MRTAADGRGIISCLELAAVQDKPAALLHRAHVAARRALRDAPRGGRPPQAEARVLLRRGAPALRGRDARLRAVGHADRAAHPLQGRRRSSSSPRRRRTCPATCSASSATACSTRCARSPRTTRRRSRRRSGRSRRARTTTSRSCCPALGIGEAIVTVLDSNGVPTPVVHTRLRGAELAHGAGRRRRGRGAGLAAVGQVRHADGRRRAPGSSWRPGSPRPRPPRRSPKAERAEARRTQAGPGAHPGAAAPPRAAPRRSGGLGDFLSSRQGKQLQKEVVRGVFGLLRKRL